MDVVRKIEFATYGATSCEPFTLALVVLSGAAVIILPRIYAVIPILTIACLINYGQRFVIAGADFEMVRVMFVLGAIRIALRPEEAASFKINPLDKAAFWLATPMTLVPILVNPGQITWAAGFLINNVLGYYVLRVFLADSRSLIGAAGALVVLSIPICVNMLLERSKGFNYFHVFGAPSDVVMREGALRAEASFDHPILAGSFGSLIFPLAWMLWVKGNHFRLVGIIGMITSVLIVYASKSSGPLFGLMGGIFAIGLWVFHKSIRRIRNYLWITLILLQFVMNAPVYALIFRIPDAFSFITGSTSFHRYLVIDAAIKNVGQWWLLGASMDIIGTWGYGVQDVTNHFIAVGYGSGVLGIILLIIVFVRGFSLIGKCLKISAVSQEFKKLSWALGCLLFVHLTNFLGVLYFSGFWTFMNITVAMIAGWWDVRPLEDECSAEAVEEHGSTPEVEASGAFADIRLGTLGLAVT